MSWGLESMHLLLEVGGLSTKDSLSAMSTASSSSLRLQPLAQGRAPTPAAGVSNTAGWMFLVE